jgi:hypothetical protein
MKHRIDADGCEYWYDENNLYHRDDGPAIIADSFNYEYFQHGKLHRLDGPAIVWTSQDRWFINGLEIICDDNEDFLRIVKMKELL